MIEVDIIEEREEQIIGTDKTGNLVILPNSLYYKMKREMGGRILYKMDEEHQILETFDDRIFNIICGGHRFQSRPGVSDELTKIIQAHKKGDVEAMPNFKSIVMDMLSEKVFSEVVDEYFKGVRGLKTVRGNDGLIEKFVYKDLIWIDKRGACYQKINKHGRTTTQTNDGERAGSHVCIVANGINRKSDGYTVPTKSGLKKINGLTMEIIAKIAFLLSPNFKDSVFTSQLSADTRRALTN